MTEEELIKLGFKKLPHFTIHNSLDYDLGRNRTLTVGSLGTPNEIICVTEKDIEVPHKITDIIVIRNYDYDGYTSLEDIKQIIKVFIGNK